jgi:hypothetical protein
MKIVLLHSSLHFVSTGTPKMHALDNRFTSLMCGRGVNTGSSAHPSRQLASQICGRCLASLRTYTSDYVRFEKEVSA